MVEGECDSCQHLRDELRAANRRRQDAEARLQEHHMEQSTMTSVSTVASPLPANLSMSVLSVTGTCVVGLGKVNLGSPY